VAANVTAENMCLKMIYCLLLGTGHEKAVMFGIVGVGDTMKIRLLAKTVVVLVLLTVSLFLSPSQKAFAASSQGPIGGINPAYCMLRIEQAHLSTYLANNASIQAVKVNASIDGCEFPVSDMSIKVTLIKRGFIFNHKQKETTKVEAVGDILVDQDTWRGCSNNKESTFFGIAEGRIRIGDHIYSQEVASDQAVSLPCGT
jgi:hypothetical protein